MAQTFFFYDLETSGIDWQTHRIMQFAGQRTDMDLNPVGDPVNVLVTLADDTLPDPGAVAITGLTPQQTKDEGISEVELARLLDREVFTDDTIVVGYNNIRFDDNFIRHLMWRHFYDPYEWSWNNGRSRWDLLDVVRMTRALRPDGMTWPMRDDGAPNNKLEAIAEANGVEHLRAHDAMSDIEATIQVAKLIKTAQPKLFDFLLQHRGKKEVAEVVRPDDPQPFIYTSGRYGGEFGSTTVAVAIGPGNSPSSVLVYDLRYDPSEYSGLDQASITRRLFDYETKQTDGKIPVKELVLNRCPTVAPLAVLQPADQERLSLDMGTIRNHLEALQNNTQLITVLVSAYHDRPEFVKDSDKDDVEYTLYDGFGNPSDNGAKSAVRAADADKLADFHPGFKDGRLEELLLRYKARNYPSALADDEREAWEAYRAARLQRMLPAFVKELQAKSSDGSLDEFLTAELQLWAESIMPIDVS